MKTNRVFASLSAVAVASFMSACMHHSHGGPGDGKTGTHASDKKCAGEKCCSGGKSACAEKKCAGDKTCAGDKNCSGEKSCGGDKGCGAKSCGAKK